MKELGMRKNLMASANTSIAAPPSKIWTALITPAALKEFMFGADVTSDWKTGSPITWQGEVNGKKYRDKGTVVNVDPGHTLQYTHFSSLAGKPDKPENYHTITIQLKKANSKHTEVSLDQDNNPDEKSRMESEKNWDMMLSNLKKYVEHH
jgi:uncharacterized protein YndB with AHSA1/START domain